MRTKKEPQADLDNGFKSGGFPIFNHKFQRFCHRLFILVIHKKPDSISLCKIK